MASSVSMVSRQDFCSRLLFVIYLLKTAQHRRIDMISVPYEELATLLIYFTGSAHFTRSIYGKAKSMGMRLNQHALRAGVMRQVFSLFLLLKLLYFGR